MDDESTQGEQRDMVADEPTLYTKGTVDDENLTEAKEVTSQEAQISSSLIDDQHAVGNASVPPRRRKLPHILLYAALLLIGIVLGAIGMLLFQLSIGGTRSPVPVTLTPVASGNVTVHADQSAIIPLLQNSVQAIDLPANGSVSNVQIQFVNGNEMNITGDYQVSVLGVPVSQPFTLDTQLIVDNCQVQVRVLQANFSGISVTGLVSLFEDSINQKLAQLIPQNNLPGNIEFCLINIATDAQGVTATFSLVVPSTTTPTANTFKPIAIF